MVVVLEWNGEAELRLPPRKLISNNNMSTSVLRVLGVIVW